MIPLAKAKRNGRKRARLKKKKSRRKRKEEEKAQRGRGLLARDVDAKHYADGRWTAVVSRLSNEAA